MKEVLFLNFLKETTIKIRMPIRNDFYLQSQFLFEKILNIVTPSKMGQSGKF